MGSSQNLEKYRGIWIREYMDREDFCMCVLPHGCVYLSGGARHNTVGIAESTKKSGVMGGARGECFRPPLLWPRLTQQQGRELSAEKAGD